MEREREKVLTDAAITWTWELTRTIPNEAFRR